MLCGPAQRAGATFPEGRARMSWDLPCTRLSRKFFRKLQWGRGRSRRVARRRSATVEAALLRDDAVRCLTQRTPPARYPVPDFRESFSESCSGVAKGRNFAKVAGPGRPVNSPRSPRRPPVRTGALQQPQDWLSEPRSHVRWATRAREGMERRRADACGFGGGMVSVEPETDCV